MKFIVMYADYRGRGSDKVTAATATEARQRWRQKYKPERGTVILRVQREYTRADYQAVYQRGWAKRRAREASGELPPMRCRARHGTERCEKPTGHALPHQAVGACWS